MSLGQIFILSAFLFGLGTFFSNMLRIDETKLITYLGFAGMAFTGFAYIIKVAG